MPGNCPLCGSSVALLRRTDPRAPKQILRDRIASLRQRADDLRSGDTTPRRLKDDALWMCRTCQRIMADGQQLTPGDVQRRIHEEVRRLERDARSRAS